MATNVRAAGVSTKEQIVGAAIETLRTEGFGGTSARAIARIGDFNQALIFYHFGSVNGLLLEALRLAPSAMLYSRVPRSSAWPSTVTLMFGHLASQAA